MKINLSRINQIILGSNLKFAVSEEKDQAIFTLQLNLVGVIIAFIFLIIKESQGIRQGHLALLMFIAVGIVSFLLTRRGFFVFGKLILMSSANLSIFFSVESESQNLGTYASFILCVAGSVVLFGNSGRWKAVFMAFFSILLFLISFYFDLPFIKKSSMSENFVPFYAALVYSSYTIILILLLLFMLRQNAMRFDALKKTTKENIINIKKFDQMIEGSSVGIWDWDLEKQCFHLTPFFIEFLGYKNKDKLIKVPSDKALKCFHPKDKREVIFNVYQHLNNKKPCYFECRIKKYDGTYVWFLVSGQAFWEKSGKPKRMLGTVVKIDLLKSALNKLKNQNELLEKTNEELDRFVYSTSHDLKAPLSSILGLVNIAEISNNEKEINYCLDRIKDRVHKLNRFITDIINYSRNMRLDIDLQDVEIRELLDDVLLQLKYLEQYELIEFQIAIPKPLYIKTDRNRIEVVLKCLIENSIKYHDFSQQKKHIVHIGIKEEKERFVIIVKDNGVGIPKEYYNNIFSMFYRGSEYSDGAGLGLYIANETTTKMGGNLYFKSVERKGSTFYLEISKF